MYCGTCGAEHSSLADCRITDLVRRIADLKVGADLAKRAGGVMRRNGLGLLGVDLQIELREYYDKRS